MDRRQITGGTGLLHHWENTQFSHPHFLAFRRSGDVLVSTPTMT
ncbi:MAG: hypothetical protein N3D11_08405 [Candidatus Sumerlaeia bacterium]|nr:hypothetical protein [Candidatus Sumerlaeia bacterium]